MQNPPNDSYKEESGPEPLSNFLDLGKEESGIQEREIARKESNLSKNNSILETSEQLTKIGFKMQESNSNTNNLQGLTSLMRAPSFSGPNDFVPAKNLDDYNRQGSGMSSSKPISLVSNNFMGNSNPDYIAQGPGVGQFYEDQINADSEYSSVRNSGALQHLAPTVFVRAPSKIEVKTDSNLNDSTVKNRIDPSPLGLKSPYPFENLDHASPFPNLNNSTKPMLSATSKGLNGGKFFDTTSPITQPKTANLISPAQTDSRSKGGIYNLPPKFDILQESQSVVEIFNLSKEFDLLGRTEKVRALSDVNLNEDSDFYPIKKGEFVMIRGPSGGGKTTFLNLIGTADVASSGKLIIMGSEITEKSNDEYLSRLRLEKIGFVFQTFNLLATMSAYENVELPMKLLGRLSTKLIKQRTIELLTKVGLQDRMDHLPSELSGGEQQRVAIARALANTPEILLLDEPTGDLDTRSTVEVMNLLLSINNFGYTSDQKKCTMIMVTHNPDLECYADRIIYFRDGKIVKQVINEVQTPLELEPYLKFLNAHNNE